VLKHWAIVSASNWCGELVAAREDVRPTVIVFIIIRGTGQWSAVATSDVMK
jgi:hypothetical protein